MKSSGNGEYLIQPWIPRGRALYKFLDNFIEEMAELFPDHYFHIGGDESKREEWDANQKIQQFKHEHNIKSNAELQAYFSVTSRN